MQEQQQPQKSLSPAEWNTDWTKAVKTQETLRVNDSNIQADNVAPQNWIFAEAIGKIFRPKGLISRRPKVYYVNYDNYGPGYYRCAVPGLLMRRIGYIEARFREEVPQDLKAIDDTIKWSNILFFQRITDQNAIEIFKEVQAANKAVVFEADDFVDDIAKTSDPRVRMYWNKEAVAQFTECARRSDGMILSTKKLTEVYANKTGNKAYWVPNGLDTRNIRWNVPFEKFDKKGYITIGYMGGSTHGQDLEVCKAPLISVLNRFKDVKIKFIGFIPDWVTEIAEEQVILEPNWRTISEYPKTMADIDIGIVPLKSMPFNIIGKSCLKWLEYSMMGAATVASRVGETGEEIRSRKTGLLASSEEGWENYLTRLIEHPDEITMLSENAARYVLNYRSIDVMIDRWLYALNSILDRREKKNNGKTSIYTRR